jgi:indole-3-glycerol phosphate synthase
MSRIEPVINAVRNRVKERAEKVPLTLLKDACSTMRLQPGKFSRSLRKDRLSLIMEHKAASPSSGPLGLAAGEPVESVAAAYQRSGAAAVSVLAEEDYFRGSPANVAAAAKATSLPVLQKDFVISDYQIYEAAASKASALLLICGITPEIARKAALCRELGMGSLIEAHDGRSLTAALDASSDAVIGINNRDLGTFAVETATFQQLAPLVPPGRILVCESGIRSENGLASAAAYGADAVLVGTAFMQSKGINELEEVATRLAGFASSLKRVGRR